MRSDHRDTQFAEWAKLVHDEQKAIMLEGIKNDFSKEAIERRQKENLAERAYDLAIHIAKHILHGSSPEDLDIPDMTELPYS